MNSWPVPQDDTVHANWKEGRGVAVKVTCFVVPY